MPSKPLRLSTSPEISERGSGAPSAAASGETLPERSAPDGPCALCVLSLVFSEEVLPQRLKRTRSNGMRTTIKGGEEIETDLKQPDDEKAATQGEPRSGWAPSGAAGGAPGKGGLRAASTLTVLNPLPNRHPVRSGPQGLGRAVPVTGRPLHRDRRLSCEGQGHSTSTSTSLLTTHHLLSPNHAHCALSSPT